MAFTFNPPLFLTICINPYCIFNHVLTLHYFNTVAQQLLNFTNTQLLNFAKSTKLVFTQLLTFKPPCFTTICIFNGRTIQSMKIAINPP